MPTESRGKKNTPPIRLVPPWFMEGGFYASVFYAILAPIFGIQIDRLGIVFLAFLAFLCFLGFKDRSIHFFRLLVFPIGCAISFLMIQIMFYGETIFSDNVKPFIPWIFTLIIVQALSFRRGFLHRFVVFALFVGVVSLFFLDIRPEGDEMVRIGLNQEVSGLSNPNALAAWFGCCTVYFFVLGTKVKKQKTRFASWVIAVGSLFVVTLTVSRGALLATLVAIILGSRDFLKRGFLPMFLLGLIVLVVYGVGLFDQTIGYYALRGTEETGRGYIWPKALEGFLDSPLLGVGASNVYIFLPQAAKRAVPHNSFLFFAMSSGIIPLIFYSAYWIQAIRAAILSLKEKTELAPFHLPLVAYSLIICLFTDQAFTGSWVIVMVATTLAGQVPRQRIPLREFQNKKK